MAFTVVLFYFHIDFLDLRLVNQERIVENPKRHRHHHWASVLWSARYTEEKKKEEILFRNISYSSGSAMQPYGSQSTPAYMSGSGFYNVGAAPSAYGVLSPAAYSAMGVGVSGSRVLQQNCKNAQSLGIYIF